MSMAFRRRGLPTRNAISRCHKAAESQRVFGYFDDRDELLNKELIHIPRMIRTMNRIPMSTPAVVKPYSITFKIVLFMHNHPALFQTSIRMLSLIKSFFNSNPAFVKHIAEHNLLPLL
jgi:hypothetical protein